jgi:hypothetical protein
MRAADLTQAIVYRIDGIPDVLDAEYGRWHYIGTLEDEARFVDPQGMAVTLEVDRLTEVERGHLVYKSD